MKSRSVLFLVLILIAIANLNAQKMKALEFRNQPITDILMALAQGSGVSIIPDDTVSGTATFYFSDSDFDKSLGEFLSNYRLHFVRSGNTYYISRIAVSYDGTNKTVSMQAEDVDIESLIRALSKAINTTILYDPMPKTMISVAINNLSVADALDILTRRLSDYSVEKNSSFFFVRKQNTDPQSKKSGNSIGITKKDDKYALSVDKARFTDLLTDLFKKSGKEYSMLTRSDAILENLYFSERDFDSLLRLILEQAGADYTITNGIYYITEMQKSDIMRKLKKTNVVTLDYLNAQDFISLLPSQFNNSAIKTDKSSNTLFITGSEEEVKPILNFIELVDKPMNGLTYRRFDTKYLKVKDAIGIIPQKFTPLPPIIIPDSNSFIILGSQDTLNSLADYLQSVDKQSTSYPVRLRYIRTDDFLKNLPPSISKDEIIDSGYPNQFFFSGSDDKRKLLLRELSSLDKPKPQIRYELLVIQYTKTNSSTYNASINVQNSSDAPSTAFVGNLSDVFSLSFDVVSQFGYQFASKLSCALGENLAQVYADTTLSGISGQEIKFQNTDTSRYQALEYNETTKTVTGTGVVKEITSGLIVTLNGWISGDNMITITVNATVSRQNASGSSSSSTKDTTSTLPSTSERIVTTQVRTPSGKPIIISGLIKEDVNKNTQRFPVLGYIPLIGRMFRNETESKEKNEIVIYIVPHLIYDAMKENTSDRLERYYQSFVNGNH